MIYQNAKDSLNQFKRWGCYYFSILEMVHTLFPELGPLTMAKAIEIYNTQINDGEVDVREDMLIENPQNLIDDIVGKNKLTFLGKFPVGYLPLPNEHLIQYWVFEKNFKVMGTHFTYLRQSGEIYDPWYPASPWRTNGKLAGYRVYRKEA